LDGASTVSITKHGITTISITIRKCILIITMLNAYADVTNRSIMLSVVMLNVIMLNVVAPICTGSVPPPRPRWALLFKYGLFWPRRTQRINKIKYLIVLQSPESFFCMYHGNQYNIRTKSWSYNISPKRHFIGH